MSFILSFISSFKMQQAVQTYLFEKAGVPDLSQLKNELFEELKLACSSEDAYFDGPLDIAEFVEKIYRATRRDTQFWLDTKGNFFGNEKIVNLISSRCKVLNVFNLRFINDRYWDSRLRRTRGREL